MYEIMYYGGLSVAIIFLIIAIILFFYYKIVEVIKYFIGGNVYVNKKIYKSRRKKVKNKVSPKMIVEASAGATEVLDFSNKMTRTGQVDMEATEVLGKDYYDEVHKNADLEKTEILDCAQRYVEAIYDADKTEILTMYQE